VLGSDDRAAAERVAALYGPLNAPVLITDRRSAEMIKYASNAFLATKISFINEIAQVCERLGADVTVVAKGMGMDARIGSLFLQAGVGFGGSCFPKDVKALAAMALDADCHPQLLNAVLEINTDQRWRFVKTLRQQFGGDLAGRRIAIWGLAFKQNTDDMREAPSLDIIRTIEARGGHVVAYDPAAMDNARRLLPTTQFATSPYEAAWAADALCIVTPWNEFKQVDLPRVREFMRTPLVLDGRNMYEPSEMAAQGFRYISIGRARSYPVPAGNGHVHEISEAVRHAVAL
jgi:UDPglucose 6-dehydrogenase